jgi:HTH-type transcriptional regulator/antitoxin HigA
MIGLSSTSRAMIKTAKDYKAALERIDELSNAPPSTEEANELDILATLVDHYESLHR